MSFCLLSSTPSLNPNSFIALSKRLDTVSRFLPFLSGKTKLLVEFSFLFFRVFRIRIDQCPDHWNTSFLVARGQKPEIPDFEIAIRKNMQQKPADEFYRHNGHEFSFVVVGAVPIRKRHLVIIYIDNAVV